MGSLFQDIRYALRILAKSPGFTAVAILTLALGIGANTAVFSLANAAFFRPLPFPHAEQLAFLWQSNQRTGESEGAVSYPNYADWRAQSHNFQDMAFIMFPEVSVTGPGTSALLSSANGGQQVGAALVSANFFSVMGVNPIIGRAFTPDDSLKGHTNVVVIGYGLWQSRFGADTRILGRTLAFDGETDTIIGVMQRRFDFPNGAQLWKPRQAIVPGKFDLRPYPNMGVIGLLKSNVSWPQAQSEMDTIAARLATEYPKVDGGVGIRVVPLRTQLSQKIRQGLLILWGAIFGVLLIACVNGANLIMARAAGRQKEIAVRFSLGATRWQIMKQFLTESVLLAATGALAGLILAYWIVRVVSRMNPDAAKLGGNILDPRVLGYTIAIAIFTALICGMLPALSTSSFNLNDALKETVAAAMPSAQFIRKSLIVAEVALAFVLLAGSGLLIRSLWQIFNVNPGFDAAHTIKFRVDWPAAPSGPGDTAATRDAVYVDLMSRLEALPEVTALGATSNVLFPSEMYKVPFAIEGEPAASAGQQPFLLHGEATPNFFSAMGISLLRGHEFSDADTAKTAEPVAIINEAMARRYWPDANPIGKRFKFTDPNFKSPWFAIIGVVGDVHQDGYESAASPAAYLPTSMSAALSLGGDDVVLRSAGDPAPLVQAVRITAHAVNPNLAIYGLEPVSTVLSDHESERRFNAWLLGAFAFIALALAAVGVYGSVSYWVKQRTREIGIRMALGAQPQNVFALVVGNGMRLLITGLVLGVLGAFAVTRLISSMLFGVAATDPITYASVGIILAGAAVAACYLPARRAMCVDPMVALRYE